MSSFFFIFAKMKKLLRILLLVVNVAFVALLWGSTFAGFVSPSKFVWFSMLSYGYFYLLIVNILFVLVWLSMARKECLVGIIGILVRFSFLPLFFQFGGTEEPTISEGSNCISVMSYNVHHFHGRDDNPELMDTNAMLFVNLVREEQPDVMCLQEFFVDGKVKVYDSLVNMGYKYSYGIHMNKRGVPAGVALFSKYPIDYVSNIDKSQKFYADIIKRESIVRIVCVHLDSYQLTEDDRRELELVAHGTWNDTIKQTIRKFSETILCHENDWNNQLKKTIEETERPLIMAGDFNDHPASFLYHKISGVLNDSYVEQGKGFCATYHGKFPDFRIDYVWHSDKLKALSYKRIKNNISDHYPIKVTLEIL